MAVIVTGTNKRSTTGRRPPRGEEQARILIDERRMRNTAWGMRSAEWEGGRFRWTAFGEELLGAGVERYSRPEGARDQVEIGKGRGTHRVRAGGADRKRVALRPQNERLQALPLGIHQPEVRHTVLGVELVLAAAVYQSRGWRKYLDRERRRSFHAALADGGEAGLIEVHDVRLHDGDVAQDDVQRGEENLSICLDLTCMRRTEKRFAQTI